MQQTERLRKIIRNGILAIAAIAIGTALIFGFLPKAKELHECHKKHDQIQLELTETLAKENKLKENQKRFVSDPTFIEKVAHEVGYAHPNETIFHFPEENKTNDL